MYSTTDASENYQTDIFEDGHQFVCNKAFEFLDKYLKG